VTASNMATPLTAAQEKLVLITTAVVSGMGFADMTAVNTALPVIQTELGMDATSAHWVAEIYLVFVASLMMMGGALGDRFGRRRILRYGIIAFAATSILCATADSAAMLIFGRAVQGIAAALAMPSSLALLNACFPPERRGRAVGSWAAITSLMIPLGPVVGGAAVDLLSWQWIFLINVPISAFSLYTLRGVPAPPYDPPLGGRLDIPGVAAITAGLGCLVYGLLEGARRGFGDDIVIITLVAAAILLPLFLIIEAVSRDPMLPLWMFKRRAFAMANLQSALFFGGFHGTIFLLPFFLIQVYGYSAFQAGATAVPISAAIIIMSRPVGRVMDTFGPGPLLAGAPFLVGIGLFMLAHAPVDGAYLRDILPAILLFAVGIGFYITPITTVAMNAAGEGRSGLASGVNNTVARVSGLIAIALFGILLTSGFSAVLLEGLTILKLDAGQMADATEQIKRLGAMTPPAGLDDTQADAFRGIVREAFTTGFRHAVTVAAFAMFLAGVVGVLTLRKITATPGN